MKIAINGAGIAGTTLAYWLHQYGHEPVLIEQAPRPRTGGYVIDFWGNGYDVAERMGLIPRLETLGYHVDDWKLVDENGKPTGGFAVDVINHMTQGRVISLQRSDLAKAIYEKIEGKVETIFSESIASITEIGTGVRVDFDHQSERDFDLAIGADGLHSRVRGLVFGPESRFERYLGYHVVAVQVDGYRPRDEDTYVSHTRPGRQIARFSMREDKTLFLYVFRADVAGGAMPQTDAKRKAMLHKVFGGLGWEVPRILDATDAASDIYYDRVSQIHMDRWSKGRVALVGDAAAAVSLLAGEGCGLAMAETYVLAGELHGANGDYAKAFARYEELMMPFVRKKQKSARVFAQAFAPASEFQLFLRDLATKVMKVPFLADLIVGNELGASIDLPEYATRSHVDSAATGR
jgi:2-polyprenyl-6-methoxyphenol hydroxylase-like FAD-dependent oxidoreductase